MYIRLRLGALMKEKAVSEKELHDRTGVARNTIRSLARNANTRVDFTVLERLARELGVRPLELLEETEQPRGNTRPRPRPALNLVA
jgi:putative transcriptional regulator